MKLLSLVIVAGLFGENNQLSVDPRPPPPYPICPLRECWTQWFDRDNPDGTGDWETLILLRKWYRGRICDDPIEIEATTLSGTPSAATGDVIFRNNVNEGFICRTQDQCRRLCNDYRVRFRCPPFFCYPVCWTRWYYLHDLRLGPNFWKQVEEEHPGFICEHPLIQISSTDIRIRAAVTEDAVTFDAVSGFICRDENLRTASCSGYKVRFGCRCCRPPILQTE
ncbi:uncharacterized protein LOC103380932 isoform X4 [Cynoglossus semilaevis]|uniref:uncharacterized protein LOC103380932 isoform X4 n=1 Tax=Cynoglossus semilaevis TaxID=244447 RepID=UPI0004982FD3|nr:uncharacterized protein LOC103380932 isoform X4 [Cynoglossus semilaevis]